MDPVDEDPLRLATGEKAPPVFQMFLFSFLGIMELSEGIMRIFRIN